jgi:uncharacterized protein
VIGSDFRVLGIDDGPLPERRGTSVFVAAPLVRAGGQVDAFLSTWIRRDGWNATDRLRQMIAESRFAAQLHVIMLDGIALGGLNVVDLGDLHESLGVPVLTLMRRRPDVARFEQAIARLPRPARRLARVRRAGPIHGSDGVYYQCVGATPAEARLLIRRSTRFGKVPEALRLAHLIARGVVWGESHGGA